ncbi:hypothetical protein [Pseudostreptobacillus hongkongensis]|uniref:hypothetical protein n=1 Tax=Pseudostreptobacillus hongkongensis TaxID=1162717 RepID=UPI0008309471|nr:hypothetical protein [Pseudostreptobacillus hongkongensis]
MFKYLKLELKNGSKFILLYALIRIFGQILTNMLNNYENLDIRIISILGVLAGACGLSVIVFNFYSVSSFNRLLKSKKSYFDFSIPISGQVIIWAKFIVPVVSTIIVENIAALISTMFEFRIDVLALTLFYTMTMALLFFSIILAHKIAPRFKGLWFLVYSILSVILLIFGILTTIFLLDEFILNIYYVSYFVSILEAIMTIICMYISGNMLNKIELN